MVYSTNEKNPKLGVDVNNALNYKDKESGEIKQRKVETALVDIIEEAGKVSGMELGAVTMAAEINGKWQNYFVNREENNGVLNIILKPTYDTIDKSNFIYVNSHKKEIEINGEKKQTYYYTLNTNTQAGAEFVKNIGINEYINKDGTKSFYLKANIRLANNHIKEALKEIGVGHIAIISKAGFKIVNEEEMKAQKQELEKATTIDNQMKVTNGYKKEQIINKNQNKEIVH